MHLDWDILTLEQASCQSTISNRQTGVISDCEINAVLSANAWKLVDNNSKPHSAVGSKIEC